jgi:hypothetical protein
MADDDTPRNADFVARVVKDAKSPPETRMLTGWLGDAPEEGERRLYTNADLSCYIDIPTDAILHTEPIRDVQPPGGVFVWVQRDAALKPGGSASSRAARFLQGQVQEDFASGASPEAEGYRCVTQVPCGEPTGFTGRCTKQPVVGGAWPCITVLPHCSEPTGFTGQCTHQPWPNPTQYLGCTFYHCPTQDLTHIPHICNLVATGMPGCPVVNPPQEGDPAAKASAEGGKEGGGAEEARAALPVTSIPGCGYTRTWGLCPTLPPKCQVSVDIPCITRTETPGCFGGNVAARPREPGGRPSFFCTPDFTTPCMPDLFARQVGGAAGPTIPITTQLPSCNPSAVDACPTRLGCNATQPPTAIQPCTQVGPLCPPTPVTTCTQIGPQCPTYCGPDCQTQQGGCTQVNCTQAGAICTTVEHNCAAPAQPQAFRAAPIGPTIQAGAQCPTQPSGDCTFFGCPPTPATVCTQIREQCITQPSGDCTFFGCPPTPATVCTQIREQCITQPSGDCTFFGCPPTPLTICTVSGPQCPPTPATVCTQVQQQCPTQPSGDCTFFNCPTVLCQARQPQNFAAVAPQMRPMTIPVWQCHAPTPATHCFICPPITQPFVCGGTAEQAPVLAPTGVFCYVTQGCTAHFTCHFVTTWNRSCR